MEPSILPCDILTALRAATGDAHRRLEAAVEIEACLANRERYMGLLQSFLGFYRPLEDRLFARGGWVESSFDPSGRRKTPWLAADLHALGLSQEEIKTQPDCASLPAVRSHAQGFGCLYVLEGATLGGRQITALLQDSPIPVNARRFFGSYGAETGARWREFVASLQREAASAEEVGCAEIVTAAQQTFACLQGWIVERYIQHELAR